MAQAEATDFEAGVLLDEVRRIRTKLPGIGVEKLHFLFEKKGFYKRWGLKMGRDKLGSLLAQHGQLAKKKRARARTTNSLHRFHKYPNLAKEVTVRRPEQVWAADITYLPVGSGFSYLSMVTDAHSRKIVGWALSRNLSAQGCLDALKMAIDGCKKPPIGLLHHSDRGVQYCCGRYVKLLNANKIGISMTINGDPYENALAERMNRTIKEEMLQNRGFVNHLAAVPAVRNAIEAYNNLRPHASLDFGTPQSAHRAGEAELKKRWQKRVFKSVKTKTETTTNTNPAASGMF